MHFGNTLPTSRSISSVCAPHAHNLLPVCKTNGVAYAPEPQGLPPLYPDCERLISPRWPFQHIPVSQQNNRGDNASATGGVAIYRYLPSATICRAIADITKRPPRFPAVQYFLCHGFREMQLSVQRPKYEMSKTLRSLISRLHSVWKRL
jgi:hypothetical protein